MFPLIMWNPVMSLNFQARTAVSQLRRGHENQTQKCDGQGKENVRSPRLIKNPVVEQEGEQHDGSKRDPRHIQGAGCGGRQKMSERIHRFRQVFDESAFPDIFRVFPDHAVGLVHAGEKGGQNIVGCHGCKRKSRDRFLSRKQRLP